MNAGAGSNRRIIGKAIAFGAALALAHVAQAQDSGSVNDYRLPDPKQTPTPRVQGPVDPDNPYSRPSDAPQAERSTSSPPLVQPSAAPRVVPTAPRTSEAKRDEPAPTPTARATPRATRSTEPTPAPSARATSAPADKASNIAPTASLPSSPVTDDARPATTPSPTESGTNWLIPVLAAAVVAVGAAAFLLRRRRRPGEAPAVVEDHASVLVPEPAPRPLPPATRAPAPSLAAPLPVSTVTSPEPLDIAFAPQAIRLSLVYATLQYELVLRNTSQAATPPLQVRGDLSSAHASIPTRDQLAPAPEQLELKHEVAALEPGDAATLKGEVRVPLQQIRPLVKGSASFLVPLARFVVLPGDGAGSRRVYTLGPRDPGSGAIASVRLDAGPRNLRDLDAREIEAARGFALDPQAIHS